MKKVLLYFPFDIDNKNNISIYLKSESIADSFAKEGIEVDKIYHRSNDSIDYNNKIYQAQKNILKPIPSKVLGYYLLNFLDHVDFTQYDAFILRFKMASPFSEKLLKAIKKSNPDIKIILEYPTYPFKNEFSNILVKNYIRYVDKYYRNRNKLYADRVITYDRNLEILGLKTLNLQNAINNDLLNHNVVLDSYNDQDTLVIKGVAGYLHNYHGFDRLVEGIAEYYSTENKPEFDIRFDIIGNDGKEVDNLLEQARELEIGDRIKYLGYKDTTELAKDLETADIGVSSLGVHRKGLSEHSSLKSGFYSYVGLPFIDSGRDSRFSDCGFDFRFEVPADDSPVEISKLIEWFKKIRAEKPNYKEEVHQFALDNLTWKSQISKVVEEIY